MLIDKAIAFLDNLTLDELDRLPAARREKSRGSMSPLVATC